MQKSLHTWVALACVTLTFSSCVRKNASEAEIGKTETKSATRELNLSIWSNYISSDFLAEFTSKTGIRVNISNYSSNEELLGKLQAGASGIDLAVPSDYMVFIMSKLGLLAELDKTKAQAWISKIDPQVLGREFDPKNQYSLPYGWGTTGIAVNRNLYKGEVKSWKDLLDNPAAQGKFSLLDDARETVGAALKALGYSLNTTNPDELAKAKTLLMKARKHAKAFNSDPYSLLTSGEVALAHAYSSDALKAGKETGGKIEYVLPKEGGTLWIDCLVIPEKGKNRAEVYELINFLMEPRVNASRTSTFFSAPVVQGAHELLSPDLQNNKNLFPWPDAMKKLEMMKDLGDKSETFERLWTELKSAD